MKKAFIIASELNFNKEAVLNDNPIAWMDELYEAYGKYDDIDGLTLYMSAEALMNDINAGCCIGADDFMVVLNYTSFDGKHFKCEKYDNTNNISARFCITCRPGVYNGDTRINAAESIRCYVSKCFGKDVNCQIWGYYNSDDDYHYEVYVIGDKSRILNNNGWFCQEIDGNVKIADSCDFEWSMDGSDISQIVYEGDDQCYFDFKHEEDELIVLKERGEEHETVDKAIEDTKDKQADCDKAIEQVNSDLAEFIGLIHNFTNIEQVYDFCMANKYAFGAENRRDGEMLDINLGNSLITVLQQCDGGIMVSSNVEVYDDYGTYYGYFVIHEEGVIGVESQDSANIYLEPDEKPEPENEMSYNHLRDCYMLEDTDEICYLVNSEHYLHIKVDCGYEQWSWALYGIDFKLIKKDWTAGIDIDTWISLFKHDLAEYFNANEVDLINVSPVVFHHMLDA